MQLNLGNSVKAIEGTRNEWKQLANTLAELRDKLTVSESDYKETELQYNALSAEYNEFNLQLTRQQSRISGLAQEEDFKRKQLNDLAGQVETNSSQLKQTIEQIAESSDRLASADEALITLLKRKEEEEKYSTKLTRPITISAMH